MTTKMLELDTEKGDIEIREEELSMITDAELIELGISRETLRDCFAQGGRLMQQMQLIEAGERVRLCAAPRLDGEWEVRLVRYSALSDPLTRSLRGGRLH
jgi:hypothetical protein